MLPIGVLRQFSEAFMPDIVDVKRKTRVSDGEGGFVTTWVTVATTKGDYRTAGARELEIASHLANSVDGVLTLPFDTDVQDADQLVRNGKTYNVSGIMDASEELSAHLEVLVRLA